MEVDPFALVEDVNDSLVAFAEVLIQPSLEDFSVPIDLSNDVDIGYEAPVISNWTKQLYGDPSASSCAKYF